MKNSILISGVVAFATLIGASATALAANALVTNNLNVRTGPGTQFGIVGVLAKGSHAKVRNCINPWCHVKQGSLQGWANHNYLSIGHVQVTLPSIIIRPPHHYWPRPPRPPHPRPPHLKPPVHKPVCKIAPGLPCK